MSPQHDGANHEISSGRSDIAGTLAIVTTLGFRPGNVALWRESSGPERALPGSGPATFAPGARCPGQNATSGR